MQHRPPSVAVSIRNIGEKGWVGITATATATGVGDGSSASARGWWVEISKILGVTYHHEIKEQGEDC